MFHPYVVEERISRLQQQFGVRLHRYTVDESRYVSEVQLENKRDLKTGRLVGLTHDEQLFIQNEILLSRADFRYWFERYPKIILDDATGETGHPKLWESQTVMLTRLGERELDMWQKWHRGHQRFDGNRWYIHKARQMGLSAICEGINAHAVNFYTYTNCLIGSKNQTKTEQVYKDYGYLMWASQPDWMKVPAIQDHKEKGIVLANGSKMVLQHSEQESGFGQGAKWHRSHLTEIAAWNESVVSDHIDNHYEPSISRSIKCCAFLESTSQGLDNYWHRNTERARAKRLNWWWYLFIPWWVIPSLYIIEDVPMEWEPKRETLEEEELIIRSSPEFNGGTTYRPSKEQMYWWESQRATFSEKSLLNEFYKNYPSIPEQSFTHSGRSSFRYEVLERCTQMTRDPLAFYDFIDQTTPNERIRTAMERGADGKLVDPPPILDIGGEKLGPMVTTEEDLVDPRGYVLVWELPKDVMPFETYAGVDTTGGIEGWTKDLRRENDDDINNACISIIRSGHVRDVDVCEFVAPITPKPLARYHNAMARLWQGRNNMDGQTPTIVELTGEGLAFQEELISSYDFFAFYQHFAFNGSEWKETNQFGWKSNPSSIRHMWAMFKNHVTDVGLITRSKYLVREMRSCTDDMIYVQGMTRGKAPKRGGRHDDRVYSRAFAVWFANSFANPEPKPSRSPVPRIANEGKGRVKLHQMDFGIDGSMDEYLEDWEARLLVKSGIY